MRRLKQDGKKAMQNEYHSESSTRANKQAMVEEK